jgi:signal peptidase II
MLTNKILRPVIIVLILVFNIGCDQISKSLVRSSLHADQQIRLFDNRIMLTRVENAGAFLSLGDSLSHEIRFLLLVLIPVIVLSMATVFLFLKDEMSRSLFVGMGFVVGGGIGNIYDRLAYGSVTDFLHLDFYLFKTGIFNMADVSIMTGVFIVLISFMIKQTKSWSDLPTDRIA